MVGSRAWARRAAARAEDVVVYYNFDAIGFARSEPGTQRIPDGFSLLFPDEIALLEERQSRADFIVAIADERAVGATTGLADHARAVGLPIAVLEIPALLRLTPVAVDLHRSDHASFWDAGFPAVMITDTAEYRSERYHCRGAVDDAPSVDASFLGRVVEVTTAAVSISLMDGVPTTGDTDGGSSQPTQP
jgi:Zn-dependent M28 family amino/carboxypeptidase